jgi:uncharacterized integral membrane protein (TIGR00698 family)
MMWFIVFAISLVSFATAQTTFAQSHGFGALPIAILLGIVVGNSLTLPTTVKSSFTLEFCKKRLLRLGIILFGSHLTISQLVAVGWQAVVIDAVVISSVLVVGYWFGAKVLKMSPEETLLTSVGSAVCGAAAILATEPVLKAKQQQVSVAVATVVVFGTLALFCYPFIFQFTSISPSDFGIYIGSTVHEVAQAVAAGQAVSSETMETAVIVKLIRVMMLAPVVIIIGSFYQRINNTSATESGVTVKAPWPWFVLGFIAVVGLNSFSFWPESFVKTVQMVAQLLLTIAMAALGYQTKLAAVKQAGSKPLMLSALLFILLMVGGFALHRIVLA